MHCHILTGSPCERGRGLPALLSSVRPTVRTSPPDADGAALGDTDAEAVADEVASAGLNLPGSGQAGISGSVYLLYGLYELEATGRSGGVVLFLLSLRKTQHTSLKPVSARYLLRWMQEHGDSVRLSLPDSLHSLLREGLLPGGYCDTRHQGNNTIFNRGRRGGGVWGFYVFIVAPFIPHFIIGFMPFTVCTEPVDFTLGVP